jgi:hypothetical protein
VLGSGHRDDESGDIFVGQQDPCANDQNLKHDSARSQALITASQVADLQAVGFLCERPALQTGCTDVQIDQRDNARSAALATGSQVTDHI